MKKIKEKFKNIFKDKKVKLITLGVLILILLVLAICFIIRNNHKLTKLEEIKINEISDKYMNYMDDVEDTTSKDNDRYILYALDYSYYELDKNTLTTGELRKLINSIFNIDIKEQNKVKQSREIRCASHSGFQLVEKVIFRQAVRLRETRADEEKAAVGVQRYGRRLLTK